jgi:hypothetical protein
MRMSFQLTKYGAYSPEKIYTVEQMKDLVEYARIRGVKIVPEFDAPAHVGKSRLLLYIHTAVGSRSRKFSYRVPLKISITDN